MMKKVLLIIIFLCGLSLFCYPLINRTTNDFEMKKCIKRFQNTLTSEDKSVLDLNDLFLEFQQYNQELYESKQVNLVDPFSYEQASFNLKRYGFEDEMFGYLSIPKLSVELPIYLGATNENLNKGAVHLSETSLPIGTMNSNSVIAAHNGWYGKTLFRHLNQFVLGDEIKVTNVWETLTYEVVEIEIIQPDEIDKVLIQEGRELITLMTCHPYGKNTERYLVYAERVYKN